MVVVAAAGKSLLLLLVTFPLPRLGQLRGFYSPKRNTTSCRHAILSLLYSDSRSKLRSNLRSNLHLVTERRFSSYAMSAVDANGSSAVVVDGNGNGNGKRKKSLEDDDGETASSSAHLTNKRPRHGEEEDGSIGDLEDTSPEDHGVVLRKFYPPEMSDERVRRYIAGDIERPSEGLARAMAETKAARERLPVGDAVVHWFKCDLRMGDNRGLHLAGLKAKSKAGTAASASAALIGLYVLSPQDLEAHLTSPARVDFILRSLEVLRADLAALDIPLHVEVVEEREEVAGRVVGLCEAWGASHVFCNVEYEVDELRREAALTRDCLSRGIAFTAVHDTCVVDPGLLKSKGTGGQFSVYSPWFRAWCAYVNSHPDDALDELPAPDRNPDTARDRFRDVFSAGEIPSAPPTKRLTDEERRRFKTMWPPGEHEAGHRLDKFIDERVRKYSETRNFPAGNTTAVVSVHLASGTLAARTCVRRARDANSSKSVNGGDAGIQTWISEVAWRDFYKHILAHWPHVCMNKPFKPEYSSIRWEHNDAHLTAWTEGQTGYPIVDAAMRQLAHTGYMHNRCRMIVASFLTKHLLLDWRLGEAHFMRHLIDGDFASNNGGWGFSSGAGVDPQPYFRIFNPELQGRRFDPDGVYVRRWVPELRGLGLGESNSKSSKGGGEGDIHNPYNPKAAALVLKSGYPPPIVEHKFARDRALARYKDGLGRGKA